MSGFFWVCGEDGVRHEVAVPDEVRRRDAEAVFAYVRREVERRDARFPLPDGIFPAAARRPGER